MQEEWLKRRDNSRGVNLAQAVTGRTITAAAAIMTVVFGILHPHHRSNDQDDWTRHGHRHRVDARTIRTVLVPAAMHWLGNANWRSRAGSIGICLDSKWSVLRTIRSNWRNRLKQPRGTG